MVIDGATKSVQVFCAANVENIKTADGDYLVVDGVTKTDNVPITRACSEWRDSVPDRCFITVSSVSMAVALEQNEEAKISSHEVASWSLDQYLLACNDVPFFGT